MPDITLTNWQQTIASAEALEENTNWLVNLKEGSDFYKGQQNPQSDYAVQPGSGEYPVVTVNKFSKIVDHILNSVYSVDPNIMVESRGRFSKQPNSMNLCVMLKELLELTWETTEVSQKVLVTFLTSFFTNTSWVKVEPDELRGLWTLRAIQQVIVDPSAKSDIGLAKWVCYKQIIPVQQLVTEYKDMFRPEAIQKLLQRSKAPITYADALEVGSKSTNDIVVYWIYTNCGKTPNQEEENKDKILAFCYDCDEWLYEDDNPSPYLESDEFPVGYIRLGMLPDQFIGTAPWRRIRDLCRAYNNSATHLLNDIKTTSQRFLGYNKQVIMDISNVLNSKDHMVAIACDGDPSGTVAPFNIGQNDKHLVASLEWNSAEIDGQFDTYEISRGEGGGAKTATEAEILATQSNISLRTFNRALDSFLNDVVDKLGRAMLYYIPAYSVYAKPTPNGVEYFTRAPQLVPTTMPDLSVQMVPQLQEVISPVKKEVKGIDIILGEEQAQVWASIDRDNIASDISFKIEAGSQLFTKRQEKKQAVEKRLDILGPILMNLNAWDKYYDLLLSWDQAMSEGTDTFLPSKDEFIQLMQAKQMAPPPGQGAPGGAEGGGPLPQPKQNVGQIGIQPPHGGGY